MAGVLAIAVASADGGIVTRVFPLAGQGEFEIRYPVSWQQEIEGALGMPPTLVFTPPTGNQFLMQMTPFPNLKGTGPEEVRKMVEQMAEKTLKTAVESALPVRPIEGPNASGFAYSATDKAPKEDEWRCVTQGVARVGRLIVTFTFLTRSHEAREVGEALEMIRTARHRPEAAPDESSRWTLAYPGREWSLVLDLPGFRSTGRQTRPDGKQVMAGGENDAQDMIITVYLEKADMPGNAVAYRDRHRRRLRSSPVRPSEVQTSERGLMAMLEYVHRDAMGIPLNQKHMNGIIVHDGVWIDIHVSKSRYRPENRPLFDAIYNSVRIVQDADPVAKATGPATPGHPSPGPPTPGASDSTPRPADAATPNPKAAGAEAAGTYRALTIPDRGWSLVLDALGITMDSVEPISTSDEDGSGVEGQRAAGRFWSGSETASGYRLSVLMRPAEKPGDAIVCRDALWERFRGTEASRVRKSGNAEQAYVEYIVPSDKTRDLRVFRVHDGYWIAIHLSKVGYKKSDAVLFENLRSSIAIRERPATRP